jgi:hypothetical protein
MRLEGPRREPLLSQERILANIPMTGRDVNHFVLYILKVMVTFGTNLVK